MMIAAVKRRLLKFEWLNSGLAHYVRRAAAIAAGVFAAALTAAPVSAQAPAIVFVTQTPNPMGALDFATVTGPFGSHRGATEAAPRGGSLYIRYPDGGVRDILDDAFKAACDLALPACDPRGVRGIDATGVLTHGVAVRSPTIHWNGDRVLFAMSVGAVQFENRWHTHEFNWRLYEIEGLAADAVPILREIQLQPDGYNNIDPVYGSIEGEIFFTSDRPATGDPKHYPQLDEYESTPTVSGLWKLNVNTGDLRLLDHAPSGAFDPFIDQNGHIVYTRWDHLQADQQANDALSHVANDAIPNRFKAYTYADENDIGPSAYETVEARIGSALDASPPDEERAFDLAEPFLVEPHRFNPAYVDPTLHPVGESFGAYKGHVLTTRAPEDASGRAYRPFLMATFAPWQINQNGREHKSLRHMGRHDVLEYINGTFVDDPSLSEHMIPRNAWAFNISEDPAQRGRYLANTSDDTRRHTAGALFTMTDQLAASHTGEHENADAMPIGWLTDPDGDTLYRDALFLSDGALIASTDLIPLSQKTGAFDFYQFDFQLRRLERAPSEQFYTETSTPLVPAIAAQFSYYEGGGSGRLRHFDGDMWMLDAAEVRATPRPTAPAPPRPADVEAALAAAGVEWSDFETFLAARNLAAVIVRNVTRRDDIDRQQPYNLFVDHPTAPSGAESIVDPSCAVSGFNACLYGLRYFQMFENKLIRGYERLARTKNGVFSDNGRRGLARPMDNADALALSAAATPGAPPASAIIAADGSVAMLAPAQRALSWLVADAAGAPVVRERVWLTLQPGEVRVCNGCHGANELDQMGDTGVPTDLAALDLLIERLKQDGLPSSP